MQRAAWHKPVVDHARETYTAASHELAGQSFYFNMGTPKGEVIPSRNSEWKNDFKKSFSGGIGSNSAVRGSLQGGRGMTLPDLDCTPSSPDWRMSKRRDKDRLARRTWLKDVSYGQRNRFHTGTAWNGDGHLTAPRLLPAPALYPFPGSCQRRHPLLIPSQKMHWEKWDKKLLIILISIFLFSVCEQQEGPQTVLNHSVNNITFF